MTLLQEGQDIRGTYEVERFLGEGAFAEVYRVKHRFLGRQAMKVFKRSDMTMEETQEVLGEAILLSKLHHPNIVQVFDANVLESDAGTHGYFTMENVPGGSLDKFWQSFGPRFIPIPTVVEISRQVCRGLAVAHQEKPPIIHRDVKPQNVLVGYEGDGLRARVSDFGLAKRVNPLTLLATAAGTPCFKAPEVFAEDKADSCAADVWSIGVTMYLMLTDRLPFELPEGFGWTSGSAFKADIPPPSKFNPDTDSYLEQTLLRALDINPSKRFGNAAELLRALDKWSSAPLKAPSLPRISKQEGSKQILSRPVTVDEEEARKLAKSAQRMAQSEGKLNEAADLMEEAFNKWPGLRDKYSDVVKLWRRGISM